MTLYSRYYMTTQKVRHLFGIHQKQKRDSIAPRCDWCGYRSPKQKEIARKNWERLQNPFEGGPVNG